MTTLREDRWYAVRTKPGSQRMAKAVDDAPPHRIGESIIERNLRTEGVSVYMPAFWFQVKHHRTNKLVERRLPLLVGYAFVHLPRLEFEKVRDIEGVMCFLQTNRDSGPLQFAAEDIGALMLAEDQARLKTKMKLEDGRRRRRGELNTELKRFLPNKGRGIRLNMRDQAATAIHSMPDAVKVRVLGIIKELDALDAENPVDLIANVA